jgi:hypothetical protein
VADETYAFLKAPVSSYIDRVPYWPKARIGLASIYVIQLRNPDYWLILACTTKHPETELLFDGKWHDAVDFLSEPPDTFPDPNFISFQTHKPESNLVVLARKILQNAIINLPDYLLTGNDGTSVFTDGVQVFQYPGVLKESEPLYFERWFDEKARDKNTSWPLVIFDPHSHERKAFLCRFPFIQGSEPPADEFRVRIRHELHRDSFSVNVAVKREFTSNDVKLLIFGNGFLVGDSRHQSKALEAMNTFLAYCFLRGLDTAPASVQDIGSVTIKPNGSTSQWSWSPSRLQNRRLLHKSVEVDILDKLIADFTQGLATELALDLRLLHQSAFHYIAGEHLQAFSLAWIVVERRISSLWRTTLQAKGFMGSRLDELCSSDRYTMSVMIDMLELNSVLDEDSAEMLHSIRKVRNKASHEGRIPSVEDIARALKLAVSYIESTATGLDIDSEHLLDKIGAAL